MIMTNCCYIVGPRVNLAERNLNQVKSKQKIERPGKFYPNLEIHFFCQRQKAEPAIHLQNLIFITISNALYTCIIYF